MNKNSSNAHVLEQRIDELEPTKDLSDLSSVELERINLLKKRIPSLIKNTFSNPRKDSSKMNKYLTNDLFYAIRSYFVNVPFSEEFKIAKTYGEENEDVNEFGLELIFESLNDNNDEKILNNINSHSKYIKKTNSHDLISLIKTAAVNLNFNTEYNSLINSIKYNSDDIINITNRFERIGIATNVLANIIESRKQVFEEYEKILSEDLQTVYG